MQQDMSEILNSGKVSQWAKALDKNIKVTSSNFTGCLIYERNLTRRLFVKISTIKCSD